MPEPIPGTTSTGPSSSGTRESGGEIGRRLPPPGAGRKLYLILYQAGKHLKHERSPRHPKSIWTKADDLCWNLPRWRNYVDRQFSALHNGAAELARVMDIADDVLELAKSIRQELADLVTRGVSDDPRAAEARDRLRKKVREAIPQIVGPYGMSQTNQKPAASVTLARETLGG